VTRLLQHFSQSKTTSLERFRTIFEINSEDVILE